MENRHCQQRSFISTEVDKSGIRSDKNGLSDGGSILEQSIDGVLVSVIIVVHNGLSYLESCLRAVLDQEMDGHSYEVLVIDNASTDGSARFIRDTFPDVKLIELPANLGFAGGNNIGYRASRGRYVAFLNQDTVVARMWLKNLLNTILSEEGLAICHSNEVRPWCPEFAEMNREIPLGITYVADLSRLGFITYGSVPNTSGKPIRTLAALGSSLLLDRQALQGETSVFVDDFFLYVEDTELALRMFNRGQGVAIAPTSVVYHKYSVRDKLSWSTFRKTVRQFRNRYLAFYRNMHADEFLGFLPWLMFGMSLNALTMKKPYWAVCFYGLVLGPLALLALAWALAGVPRHSKARRCILAGRIGSRYSLLKNLLSQPTFALRYKLDEQGQPLRKLT